jgi:purine-binding chemotaxis protein CheW
MHQDMQIVIFSLDKEDYGLPIEKVQEINRMVTITKLPNTPTFMEGIIDLRGKVIPVMDLRKRFGLSPLEHKAESRIMVTDIAGKTVGLIVDAVNEVARLSGENIEPPPPSFVWDAKFVSGVGKREKSLVILLDIDRIISQQEQETLKMDQ